ncbi:hypothetical protein CR513_52113, partial [Mucuna pruriens]
MVGWTIKLSKFDISYERQGLIKPKVLAKEGGEPNKEWMLSIDGASNQKGSRAGIVLEGPNGVLVEQSLRFGFRASNNQAEYEALHVGMRLVEQLGAQTLTAKSDS